MLFLFFLRSAGGCRAFRREKCVTGGGAACKLGVRRTIARPTATLRPRRGPRDDEEKQTSERPCVGMHPVFVSNPCARFTDSLLSISLVLIEAEPAVAAHRKRRPPMVKRSMRGDV